MRRTFVPAVFIGQNLYIKPSYIVSMPEFFREGSSLSMAFRDNQKNLTTNDTKGKLSRKAVSGLRNAINWLCLAAQPKRVYVKKDARSFSFKVSFITLTLPDTMAPVGSAELQKNLLNPWLTYMRKYHQLKNYVWRLEFQANGKLHAHITADTFLHWRDVRGAWNRLLKKHGYLAIHNARTGNWDPNSTDIHATKKIRNLAGYLASYMSKKAEQYTIVKKKKSKGLRPLDQKAWYHQRLNFWNSPYNPRPIKGRIWSCNYELSAANKTHVHVPANECAHDLASLYENQIPYKDLRGPSMPNPGYGITTSEQTIQGKKFGEILFLTARDWIDKIKGSVKNEFEKTRLSVASMVRHYTIYELN